MKKIFASILLIVLCFCSCKTVEKQSIDILTYFDTIINISAYMEEDEFYEMTKIVNSQLKKYNQFFDIYNDYDDINNVKTINDMAGIEPVKVDFEIIEILEFAKEQHDLTLGYMNVAMGAVLELWHEYRSEEILPNEKDLIEASKHCDIEKMIIDKENSTVFLNDSKMSLDLGAIAKGYVSDKICAKLSDLGYDKVLFNMGGTISSIGANSSGDAWNIGIQNYDKNSDVAYLDSVKILNNSVATSGDYQRFYIINDINYHHIINKDTLFPSTLYHSVSVVSDSAGIADTLSTALFCADEKTAKEILKNYQNINIIKY